MKQPGLYTKKKNELDRARSLLLSTDFWAFHFFLTIKIECFNRIVNNVTEFFLNSVLETLTSKHVPALLKSLLNFAS